MNKHLGHLGLPALILLAAAACSERSPFDAEGINGETLSSTASFVIPTDGTTTGNAGFFFLPPIVRAPDVGGTFDATARPVVEICALSAGACTATITEFTLDTGPGSETIRANPEDELFIVNWHTDEFDLDGSTTYRIRVLLSGFELGHVDVQVVANTGQAKNVSDGEAFLLKDGRTLPIKFRIEEGALGLTIDATALSVPTFTIAGIGTFPTDEVLSLDLAPDVYPLTAGSGGVAFEVTPAGSIDFASDLDAFLSGRGTTSLTITGAPVTVDGRILQATWAAASLGGVRETHRLLIGAVQSTRSLVSPYTIRVLPGLVRMDSFGGLGRSEFEMAMDGTLAYSSDFDLFQTGRGTNTLVLTGSPVTIDGTSLQATWAAATTGTVRETHRLGAEHGLIGPSYPLTSAYTVNLMPGVIALDQFGGLTRTRFDVLFDGTIEYSTDFDLFQTGRGTSTLTMSGVPVTIDGTVIQASWAAATTEPVRETHRLGAEHSLIGPSYPLTSAYTVNLMPGAIALDHFGGVTRTRFEVLFDGTIDYSSDLDLFQTGRGTSSLAISGVPITIDGTVIQASWDAATSDPVRQTHRLGAQFSQIGPSFPLTSAYTVNLLPGRITLDQFGDLSGTEFEILIDGTIDYPTDLDLFQNGRGSSTLGITGASVTIDATALTDPNLVLETLGTFGTAAPFTLSLMPGPRQGFSSADLTAAFFIGLDGLFDFDAVLDPFLSGRGTATLVIDP